MNAKPVAIDSARPLVAVVDEKVEPAKEALIAAMNAFTKWRDSDNLRSTRRLGESQPHLSEGVRVQMALRSQFETTLTTIQEALTLASAMLQSLNQVGDELSDLFGIDMRNIERDKTQLAARCEELKVTARHLRSLHSTVKAMPTHTAELFFVVAQHAAAEQGRRVTLQ